MKALPGVCSRHRFVNGSVWSNCWVVLLLLEEPWSTALLMEGSSGVGALFYHVIKCLFSVNQCILRCSSLIGIQVFLKLHPRCVLCRWSLLEEAAGFVDLFFPDLPVWLGEILRIALIVPAQEECQTFLFCQWEERGKKWCWCCDVGYFQTSSGVAIESECFLICCVRTCYSCQWRSLGL